MANPSYFPPHYLAPAQILPPEVLLQIFKAYLDSPQPADWSKPTVRHSMKTFSSPLPLTHVCRIWRRIATGFGDPWASIFILGPSRRQFNLIKLWLYRAHGHKLTIQFVQRPFGMTDKQIDKLTFDLMADVLFECRQWWQEIDFEFADIAGTGEPGIVIFSQDAVDSELTNLRKARLIDRKDWVRRTSEMLWWHMIYSPSLRSLETGVIHVLPFHKNLREFKTEYPLSLSLLMRILGAPGSRLEKVDVAIDGDPAHPSHQFPDNLHVFHEYLRHLSITNCDNIDLSPLKVLNALTAPNLEYLDIGEVCELQSPALLHGLRTLLGRSGCTLRTLRGLPLSENMTEADVYQVLALPQLRHLTKLKVVRAPISFHRVMTAPTLNSHPSKSSSIAPGSVYGQPSVLPNLETLVLSMTPECKWQLSDMVLSRFWTLKKVHVMGEIEVSLIPFSDSLRYHADLTVEYAEYTELGDDGEEVCEWKDRIRTKPKDWKSGSEATCLDAVFRHNADPTRPYQTHDPIFHGIRCQGCRDGDCYYIENVGEPSDLQYSQSTIFN